MFRVPRGRLPRFEYLWALPGGRTTLTKTSAQGVGCAAQILAHRGLRVRANVRRVGGRTTENTHGARPSGGTVTCCHHQSDMGSGNQSETSVQLLVVGTQGPNKPIHQLELLHKEPSLMAEVKC